MTGDVLHHGLGFQCFNCSEVAFLRDAQISHILLLFLRFGRLMLDGLGYHYFRAVEFVHRTISLELSLSLLQLLVFHLSSIVAGHRSFASSTCSRICQVATEGRNFVVWGAHALIDQEVALLALKFARELLRGQSGVRHVQVLHMTRQLSVVACRRVPAHSHGSLEQA